MGAVALERSRFSLKKRVRTLDLRLHLLKRTWILPAWPAIG